MKGTAQMTEMGGTQATNGTAVVAGSGNQYLSFVLGKEEYGIDILKVQEIRGYSAITAIPNTPAYIRGVINLRGAVVPIVDLRAKFGLAATEYDKFTVIIVVTIGTRVAGLVVDAVSDVLNVSRSDVEPTPEFGAAVDTSFITGMAKVADKLVLLLDIDRVVASADVAVAHAA
jgi:purine-binding chemotaxis protein CheW